MTHITITDHAVERYRERLRPAFDAASARRDLEQLVAAAGFVQPHPPAWHEPKADASRWVMVGDDITLPVRGNQAVTCLIRRTPPKRRRRPRRH